MGKSKLKLASKKLAKKRKLKKKALPEPPPPPPDPSSSSSSSEDSSSDDSSSSDTSSAGDAAAVDDAAAIYHAMNCLCPGEPMSKIVDALLLGCIPVLFRSARGARQFFDDVLDYDAFSITVEPADIPKLRDTLAAVPEARRDALRAGMASHHRLLLWERPYGQAYDVTLRQLCERAKRLRTARASLRCPPWSDLLPSGTSEARRGGR